MRTPVHDGVGGGFSYAKLVNDVILSTVTPRNLFNMSPHTQYPPGSQVVDEHISRDISGLRGTVETGFDRIDRRMDSMVTKDAFRAEVTRLDQRDDHIESVMNAGFSAMESKMEQGFSSITVRDAERDQKAAERDAARDARFSRRMTWTISVAGILWAIAEFIILR